MDASVRVVVNCMRWRYGVARKGAMREGARRGEDLSGDTVVVDVDR